MSHHSSVGWNPAIAPYRVLCWSPTASCRTYLSPKVSVPVTASLLTQETHKSPPPNHSVSEKVQKTRNWPRFLFLWSARAQIIEVRPIRSAGNPPPRVAQKGGESGRQKLERRKAATPQPETENRKPRVARKRRKQRKECFPVEGRWSQQTKKKVSNESKPLVMLETPQNKTKKIDLAA